MKILDPFHLQRALLGLPPEPRVVVGGNFGTPWALLERLDEIVPAYRLYAINAQPGLPDREGVTLETSFVGPGMRRSPRLRYYPSRLSMVPRLFGTTLQPDLVLIHTSTPRYGTVSLGVEVNILPAALDAVRARGGRVVAQLNASMPHTFGDAVVPVDDIDWAIEASAPLPVHTHVPPDHTSRDIGQRVARIVPDGATLQLGIGAVPDAVLGSLQTHRGLRVWSEMFSDGVLGLERDGCLDTDTPVTASFLFGSNELYDWVDGNERVVMLRSETTNAPSNIARRPLMTSVNTALQIDLFAQANASRLDTRIYSGFGGQTDFIVGALHSPGGRAIMALRSWHAKADRSAIVPLVDEPVTSFQPSVVVTEHGVAQVYGVDERGQAEALIEHAAHPAAREELREEATALGLR